MIEWVTVPASNFVMGSDGANVRDESPAQRIFLPTFEIVRTPVTNAQYQQFVQATEDPSPGHWAHGEIPSGLEEHPVTYIDWFDAAAFAKWVGGRLPTEAEWEKAARGTDGRTFPWGESDADGTRAHFGQDVKRGGTCPVWAHPDGASPYGVLDMAGNVWEWIRSEYRAYPYRADDGREDDRAQGERVLRGGSFYSGNPRYLTCATRSASFPTRRRDHIGFRVARSPKSKEKL